VVTTTRKSSLAIALAVAATGWSANPQVTDSNPLGHVHIPRLVNTCVITINVKRLVEFWLQQGSLVKTTPSFRRMRECSRFSRRRLKKSTFLARLKRKRTGA
jgi:hypothetical protein